MGSRGQARVSAFDRDARRPRAAMPRLKQNLQSVKPRSVKH